jgi:hypothetical protein
VPDDYYKDLDIGDVTTSIEYESHVIRIYENTVREWVGWLRRKFEGRRYH